MQNLTDMQASLASVLSEYEKNKATLEEEIKDLQEKKAAATAEAAGKMQASLNGVLVEFEQKKAALVKEITDLEARKAQIAEDL